MTRLTTSTLALALTLTSGAAIAQIEEEGLTAEEGILEQEGIGEEGLGEGLGAGGIGEEGLGEGLGAGGVGEGVGLYEEYGATSGILDEGASQNILRAENLIDSQIYSMASGYDEAEWGATGYYEEVGANWEEIGQVDDLVMSRDGQLVGILAEVGGWLGLGEEQVVLGLNDVRVVSSGAGVGGGLGGGGEVAFVTRLSQERLEAMPEANQGWYN